MNPESIHTGTAPLSEETSPLGEDTLVFRIWDQTSFAEQKQEDSDFQLIDYSIVGNEFHLGDKVKIINNKKYKKKKLIISAIHSSGIWLRGQNQGFNLSLGPFKLHELKKC